MTLRRFKQIARRALAQLPAQFQPHLQDLAITIQRRPSKRLLRSLGVPEDEDLFGVYDGPSLLDQHALEAPELPPRIILFYEPLLGACESEAELEREIRTTLLHEIGHHFGLDEARLEELGYE